MKQHDSRPDISVIVPVYNTERYIRQCLSSICNQSLKNIEIICINDGSTDNSEVIIREICTHDNRIILVNQKNAGPSEARKTGILQASGKYIGFVDSDDYIDKKFFECLYTVACAKDADIVATTSFFIFSEDNGISLKNTGCSQEKQYITTRERCILFLRTGSVCNKIYKNCFAKQSVKYYISSNTPAEDNSFTIFSLITASNVALVTGAKYFYRQNEASICHAPVSLETCNQVYILYGKILAQLQDLAPQDEQLYAAFIRRRRDWDCFQLAERLSTCHERMCFLKQTRDPRFHVMYLARKIRNLLKKAYSTSVKYLLNYV